MEGLPERAAIVCEQACSIEYRNGLFIVDDPAMPFARAYTPDAFFRGFHNAAKALQAYHDRPEAEILPFPERIAG